MTRQSSTTADFVGCASIHSYDVRTLAIAARERILAFRTKRKVDAQQIKTRALERARLEKNFSGRLKYPPSMPLEDVWSKINPQSNFGYRMTEWWEAYKDWKWFGEHDLLELERLIRLTELSEEVSLTTRGISILDLTIPKR